MYYSLPREYFILLNMKPTFAEKKDSKAKDSDSGYLSLEISDLEDEVFEENKDHKQEDEFDDDLECATAVHFGLILTFAICAGLVMIVYFTTNFKRDCPCILSPM